jgi:hypothetical protein
MLVVQIVPLAFGSSQVGGGNSNLIADAVPTPTPTSTGDLAPLQTSTFAPDNFSIMQITDTQFLSSTYPDLYNQLTTWIVNNNATYNLKMVVHTGDIVDQYYDSNQWVVADGAMQILSTNGIPYSWDAGNHDQNGFTNPNTGWVGDQYSSFNPATFRSQSYWVSDNNQGKNTAVKFSVSGYNFLIINLECFANSATFTWMTNLLNTYTSQNYNIIIATHAFLDGPTGGIIYDSGGGASDIAWSNNLISLLNNYPNVIMTINGHNGTGGHENIQGREQIEWNRQDEDNQQGADAARIYTFDLNSQTITVSTYSIWNSTWLTDTEDSFSFSPNLTSNSNSSSFTFGNTAIGTYFDQNSANAKSASSFICASNGQITDIYAYVARATSTGTGEAAIYADNSGQPGALIAQSNAESITTSYSWVDFQLPTPKNVTSGTVYWLSICSDDALNLYVVAGSGVRVHNGNIYSGGFSNPFGSVWGTDTTGAMSIYASAIPVNSELSVTISPTSANIVLGGSKQFNSIVTGGVPPDSYQWVLNGTAVSDATGPTWIFTPTQTGHYNVYLNVTDSQNNQTQSNIITDILVYNQSQTGPLIPDWTNVTQNFFDLVPGAVNPVLTLADVTDRAANFVADPFMFHEGNSWYMFFEVETGTGTEEIGVATSSDGFSWTYQKIVLSDPSIVLSYPYVFKWEGTYYMIPNTYPLGVMLYKATDFPYSWTLVSTLISNQNFIPADSSIFRYNNEWWMFTGTDSDLRLFYSYNLTDPDSWHEHPMSPIITNDPSKVRGGGRVTVFDSGTIIRLAQKGDVSYGEAVRAFQVDTLNETYYAEHEVSESPLISASGSGWNSWAMHTIDPWWTGDSWIVAVDGGGDYWWSIGIYVIPLQALAVSPTQVRLDLGQSQVFSSSVSGGKSPYSYQWYLNDAAVSGATSQNWIFTPSVTGHYKVYVTVTDGLDTMVQSNSVTDIIVYPQVTTSISPVSVNIAVGNTQQFTSTTTGGLVPYTYQWYYTNGTAITGASTSTLTYRANFTGTYNLFLNITDSLNYRAQSNTATLTVYSQPTVTINPTSVNMTVNTTQTFSSTATGGLIPYSYQWYYTNGTAITGATTSTLTFKANSTGTFNIYLNVTDSLNYRVESN